MSEQSGMRMRRVRPGALVHYEQIVVRHESAAGTYARPLSGLT